MRSRVTALFAVLSVLLLSGCLKVESDITIQSDDTVDATFTVAVAKQVAAESGLSQEDVVSQLSATTSGGQTVPYEDDTFVGVTTTITEMPIAQFTSEVSTGGQVVRVTREGDTFEFFAEINLDAFSGPAGAPGSDPGALAQMGPPQVSIVVTFPGEVTEANGSVNGNTVTWDQSIVGVTALQAVGGATGGGLPWLPIIAVAAGLLLLLVLIVVLLLLRRRGRNRIAPTVGSTESPQIDPSVPIAPYPPVEAQGPAVDPAPYPEGQARQ